MEPNQNDPWILPAIQGSKYERWVSVPSCFRARARQCINHYLQLTPRSGKSEGPSGWCLGNFITALSYFWCLIISGGVSHAIGNHSSLSLTVRLFTASRREKNKIKTHSEIANDDNWNKPQNIFFFFFSSQSIMKMREERVIWDVGCVGKPGPGGPGWLAGGGELQRDTFKRNAGRIKWREIFH